MPSAEREEEEEGRRSKERKHMRRKSHSRRRHHSSGGTSSRRMRSRSRSRSGSSRSRSYSRSEKHNKRDGGGSAYIPRGAHARVGSGEKHPRGSSIRNAFSKERHKPAERGPGTDNRPAVAAPPSDLPSDPHEAQRQAAQWILQQQVPGAAATQQAEKKAREVYVGNLVPGQVTEEMLTNMFSEAIATLFPDVPQPHVKRCAIESGGKYAFVEFVQKEMATVALSLRGMELFGRPSMFPMQFSVVCFTSLCCISSVTLSS